MEIVIVSILLYLTLGVLVANNMGSPEDYDVDLEVDWVIIAMIAVIWVPLFVFCAPFILLEWINKRRRRQ